MNQGRHGKARNLSSQSAGLQHGLRAEAWISTLTLTDDALGFPSGAG
jgi:hypothetical protein